MISIKRNIDKTGSKYAFWYKIGDFINLFALPWIVINCSGNNTDYTNNNQDKLSMYGWNVSNNKNNVKSESTEIGTQIEQNVLPNNQNISSSINIVIHQDITYKICEQSTPKQKNIPIKIGGELFVSRNKDKIKIKYKNREIVLH